MESTTTEKPARVRGRGLLCRTGSNILAAALSIVLTFALTGCEQTPMSEEAERPARMAPVTVSVVHPESIDIHSDYAGRARGVREVQVRARVGGILEKRLYREGQFIERGTSLVRIDPEPYQIAVERALAERGRAQAELDQALREWKRISTLFERNAVPERERDNALSARELAEAALAQTEAVVKQARLDLTYTNVIAPISGVIGLEALPEGSLLERGSLLTTITQLDPIHVHFSLPENDTAVQRLALQAMTARDERHSRMASLILPDGSVYEIPGEVDFTDSTIDPRTGTVSARVVFPNPDKRIVPGQFVRVWIEVERLEDAILIPPAAVVEGREGPIVYVVDEASIANARPVRLGPIWQGSQVILDGLQSGDRLVVNGQVALGDGARVSLQTGERGDR